MINARNKKIAVALNQHGGQVLDDTVIPGRSGQIAETRGTSTAVQQDLSWHGEKYRYLIRPSQIAISEKLHARLR